MRSEVLEERLRFRPGRHYPRGVKRKMSSYNIVTKQMRRVEPGRALKQLQALIGYLDRISPDERCLDGHFAPSGREQPLHDLERRSEEHGPVLAHQLMTGAASSIFSTSGHTASTSRRP